jgi:hypothetical protein
MKNDSDRYVHLNETALNTLLALKADCQQRGLKFRTLFYNKQHTAIKDPSESFEVACEEAGLRASLGTLSGTRSRRAVSWQEST